MTTLLAVLIVMACLWAATIWMLLGVLRLRNRSSTRRSPTQSTTPTPTSDAVALKMMETMAQSFEASTKEMRGLVVDLTQGRESQRTSGEVETPPILSEKQIVYDYDSTPLSPGIEAVIAREDQETEQARILREREELQELLIEKQAEMDRLTLEQSSDPGPWSSNGSDPKHARTD